MRIDSEDPQSFDPSLPIGDAHVKVNGEWTRIADLTLEELASVVTYYSVLTEHTAQIRDALNQWYIERAGRI
jgi:hypothetical protein